jgi:hypothetical protein
MNEYRDLRRAINHAMANGLLRASDCRQTLTLQAAGMPIAVILQYLQTMVNYAHKARNRSNKQFRQNVRQRRAAGLSPIEQASQEPGNLVEGIAQDEGVRVPQDDTPEIPF